MQNKPPSESMNSAWHLACHLNFGDSGTVVVINHTDKHSEVIEVRLAPASGQSAERKPVLVGVDDKNAVLLLDPASKKITTGHAFPEDGFFVYAYPDVASQRYWISNDGDENTGNDTLNCGNSGASITVVEGRDPARVLKTICVGRGHHVIAYTHPTEHAPRVPKRAFASNLNDGTISIIGNDPKDASTFLQVIETINLLDTRKEKDASVTVPNNAFPHGMVYSALTGKVYNLNNGYGTVVVIDPLENRIENTIPLAGCSNLLLSPNGRYLIGKGADRKSNPEHVIGKLAIIDAVTQSVIAKLDLPDIYPSTFRFNPEGDKLYVTSAATGKGVQHDNLKLDVLLVYDTARLPEITLIKEVKTGMADCSRRPIAFLQQAGPAPYVFVPNPTDGTLSVLCGDTEQVLETITLSKQPIVEPSFLFWNGMIYGS